MFPSCPCEEMKDSLVITCMKCEVEWHTNCVGMNGITKAALGKLYNWACILCIDVPIKIKDDLAKKYSFNEAASLPQMMKDMEKRLEDKIEKLTSNQNVNSFASISARKVDETNRLMKKITNKIEEDKTSQQEKDERTVLVRNYKDKKFSKDSTAIRKYLKDKYPEMYSHVEHTRSTAAGSNSDRMDTSTSTSVGSCKTQPSWISKNSKASNMSFLQIRK